MSDSFSERPPKNIEAIRQAITDGTLDAETMHRTLLTEMNHELRNEEVDTEYVNACEELLDLLNRDRASAVASHYNSNLEAIHQKIEKEKKPSASFSSHTFRFAVACSIAIGLVFGGILFSQNTIDVAQSPDGEQLLLQGKSSDDVLSNADADRTAPATDAIDTDRLDEAVAAYGSIPKTPLWIPDGWKVQQYSVRRLDGYSRFAIVYENEKSGDVFTFSEKTYSDMELLRAKVEQNHRGVTTTLKNGVTVYITTNTDLPVIEYHIGNSLYVVSGRLNKDELERCIGSIPYEEDLHQ